MLPQWSDYTAVHLQKYLVPEYTLSFLPIQLNKLIQCSPCLKFSHISVSLILKKVQEYFKLGLVTHV